VLLGMAERLGLPPEIAASVCVSGAELDLALPDCDALILEKSALPQARLDALNPKIKLVQQFGIEHRHIDLATARRLGLTVANLERISSLSCADHITALILALARNLVPAHMLVKARRDPSLISAFPAEPPRNTFNWGNVRDLRVLGRQTLGCLGLGENGSNVARRMRAMGMTVLYTKRTRLSLAEEQDLGVSYTTSDEMLARSDFVSIHVPYEPATEKLVNANFLARMKPGAYLINTARGGIVDEIALYEALKRGRLAGAALDVHRYEPMPADCPLLDLDTILWSPHIAGGRPEFMIEESEAVLANLARVLRGERPTGQLSPVAT
jgi:lactate dehydrogenase-like 2-hydroxyacid dehydrogenase